MKLAGLNLTCATCLLLPQRSFRDSPEDDGHSSGTVVWAADYKPFGEATISVSTITNNLRFPGQYYDQETGLHYNYYRDYNPVIGRYAEADPIGQWGGINVYTYTRNNPVRRTDRFGLFDAGQAYSGKLTDPEGHSDFPGYPTFDWTEEDRGWTSPYNPFATGRHFRPIDEVVNDIDRAIAGCDKNWFVRLVHQGQDYYSHYSPGYRWPPGHVFQGHAPDNNYSAWLQAKDFTEKMLKKFSAACPCFKWGDITVRWY